MVTNIFVTMIHIPLSLLSTIIFLVNNIKNIDQTNDVFDKMKSVDHVHTWLTVSHVATLSKPTTACTYCRRVTRGIGYQRTRLISVAGCTKN